jgi:hypothetical protein
MKRNFRVYSTNEKEAWEIAVAAFSPEKHHPIYECSLSSMGLVGLDNMYTTLAHPVESAC